MHSFLLNYSAFIKLMIKILLFVLNLGELSFLKATKFIKFTTNFLKYLSIEVFRKEASLKVFGKF